MAEIISTVLRDWQNLRKRSRRKGNIPPEAILKMESPTCKAKKTTKITYSHIVDGCRRTTQSSAFSLDEVMSSTSVDQLRD